jgi:hypothetical protein
VTCRLASKLLQQSICEVLLFHEDGIFKHPGFDVVALSDTVVPDAFEHELKLAREVLLSDRCLPG